MKIDSIRHSLSHIMAKAVQEMYPGAKFGIGPTIENGFYYDFDLKESLSPEDLPKIEKEMKEIIKANILFKKKEIAKAEARKLFKNQPYKLELIDEIKEKKVTVYESDWFIDLCAGPHIESTKEINSDAFKLMKIAGAYWKGSEKNPMLTRIYGVAFSDKNALENYFKIQEEAEKRDHRKLGKQLDLFSFHEEGPGFVFWHYKGTLLYNKLLEYWRKEHEKENYQEIKTPIILDRKLWERSGHWDNYKNSMYFTKIDNRDFAIKPMNCPGGILIFKEHLPSYRELPMKIAEIGLVHRHELSGTLAGLFRVRSFVQDDAHIYMTPDQIKQEVINVIDLTDKIYKKFGFSYHIELSTRPKKSIGTDKQWKESTKALEQALKSKKIKYQLNEGDGAFYGPKIDFHLKDTLGRTWQCGTIQLDMAMPDKFDVNYIAEDGNKHKVIMIHRTILGSIERFLGILIEHYAGAFPLWLSPEQIWVIPISSTHAKYAKNIGEQLEKESFRIEVKDENETVSKKIREGEVQKIPYLLVVGDREIKAKSIGVRQRGKGDIGEMKLNKFLEKIKKENA